MADLSHPPHLLSNQHLSAFIPFCAFASNLVISKPAVWLPNISFPLCSSFQATILEGQLCYKLKVNKTSGKGKRNELTLLLDYHEDLSIHHYFDNVDDIHSKTITTFNLDTIESLQMKEARIQIDTLSSDKEFGEGTYKMSVVKKMTTKSDFLEMPMKDKKCQVELFEECRTWALLGECNCVPLEFRDIQVKGILIHIL